MIFIALCMVIVGSGIGGGALVKRNGWQYVAGATIAVFGALLLLGLTAAKEAV